MSSLVLERDGTVGLICDIDASIDDQYGDNYRPQITPPMLQEVVHPDEIRRIKVLKIRHLLEDGLYGVDEKLDAVLEDILSVMDL